MGMAPKRARTSDVAKHRKDTRARRRRKEEGDRVVVEE